MLALAAARYQTFGLLFLRSQISQRVANMPTTRSRTRASMSMDQLLNPVPGYEPGQEQPSPSPPTATTNGNGKRRGEGEPSSSRKKARPSEKTTTEITANTAADFTQGGSSSHHYPDVVLPAIHTDGENPRDLVPAQLTFSFESAKRHLIRVDPRFEDIFDRLKCKPFEHLEMFDPFSTLASSILGQQISWKAARAITYRFVRLFNPALPEKSDDYKISDYFPTAHQVAKMDHAALKSAGLSGKKAEYVLDLAQRFADGRLTTERLLAADDEGLYELLTAVRGIGKWTVDMFAIFSLRRPDILPVGDLGVQRGMVRWFLSLHSPTYNITLSPEKVPKAVGDDRAETQANSSSGAGPSLVPIAAGAGVPSTPVGKGKKKAREEDDVLPTPFTPSINKTLNMRMNKDGAPIKKPFPLPVGLTVTMLKGRLDVKKKIKGAFLTPKEMEDLTMAWRPYRSLGVYYMWALAEDTKS
ncbi:Alkylbase DNA Glycosylase/Transcriptional Activator [Abortiporus biennis]